MTQQKPLYSRALLAFCTCFVLFISFFTYVYNVQEPQAFYWDENYHVASAQKYIHGIFQMEQHPPLGKMLLALGEYALNFSDIDDNYLNTTYAEGEFAEGFSITGYRLASAFLAWMTAMLLFWIFVCITRSPVLATLLSFPYIFDNALIVHSRGAMLEGPLLFFIALAILCFLYVQQADANRWRFAALCTGLGTCIGLCVMTKLTGLIMSLLVPLLAISLLPNWKKIATLSAASLIGFCVVFVAVWQVHFALGNRIEPALERDGWFKATESYKEIVRSGENNSLLSFPVMIRDSLRYTFQYNEGVPKLDLCKPDENGSPFFLWPFGARAINYRWATPGDGTYRYLYLVANPAGWLLGGIGVILASALMIATVFFPLQKPPQHRRLIGTLLCLYVCYMIAISQLDRVMYLYHYFPALLFSYILFGIVVHTISQIGSRKITEDARIIGLIVCALFIFCAYLFYRPFTYYTPLSNEQVQSRALLRIWDLRCVECSKRGMLVRPRECREEDVEE